MKPNDPPKAIYLQVYGVDRHEVTEDEYDARPEDVTWCEDKINDTDVRYVIDKRYLRKGKRQ